MEPSGEPPRGEPARSGGRRPFLMVRRSRASQTRASAEIPEDGRAFLRTRLRAGLVGWLREAATGVAVALSVSLLGLILVHLGLRREGEPFNPDLFEPYEFWQSTRGLVIHWSQYSGRTLLTLGGVSLQATVLAFAWWARSRRRAPHHDPELRTPVLMRAESVLRSLKVVAALATLTAMFSAAYWYQWRLWTVVLPVEEEKIGVAFTRQLGSRVNHEELADRLWRQGHSDLLQFRELPVTFDARRVEEARSLATRINADAVVIYREAKPTAVPSPSTTTARGKALPGVAGPPAQAAAQTHYLAYVVFVDPDLGLELPVPLRSETGELIDVAYRNKLGAELPYLESTSIERLMEAIAGILLYEEGDYLPAISHLEKALPPGGGQLEMEGTVRVYLGSANYLLGRDAAAASAFDGAIRFFDSKGELGLPDTLLLADAYTARAQILFFDGKPKESGDLLRKALSRVRPRIDDVPTDDSASEDDRATLRRLRASLGETYLGLMNGAHYGKRQTERAQWAEEARKLAKVLLEGRDRDRRAADLGTSMLYRAGSCEEAYEYAHERLAKDPRDTHALNRLTRMVGMRDLDVATTESRVYLERLLDADRESVRDLQLSQLVYGWLALRNDTEYLRHEEEVLDELLRIDPDNSDALRQYVHDVIVLAQRDSWYDPATGLLPVGDARTFERQQAALADDLGHVKRTVERLVSVRGRVAVWEASAPESAEPLLKGMSLNANALTVLSGYLYAGGVAKTGTGLESAYEEAWREAERYANAVIALGPRLKPRDGAEAYRTLAKLWRYRYVDGYIARGNKRRDVAEKPIVAAVEYAQKATVLVDAYPATTGSELFLDINAYNELLGSSLFARDAFASWGEEARSVRYGSIHKAADARLRELQRGVLSRVRTETDYFGSLACPGRRLRVSGEEALGAGDMSGGRALLERYVGKYPHDPEGLLSLGWAQFSDGEAEEALRTLDRAADEAPRYPAIPARRAIVLLARGDAAGAGTTVSRALELQATEPTGVRLMRISRMGEDLTTLARKLPGARAGILSVLPLLEKDVTRMPKEARTDRASQLILALDDLGAAYVWAGNPAAGWRLLESGRGLNPDFAQLRTNLGLALLALGKGEEAASEYTRAIHAAGVYWDLGSRLRGNEPGGSSTAIAKAVAGTRSAGGDQVSGSATARRELEDGLEALQALRRERPQTPPRSAAIEGDLRDALSRYGRKTGVGLSGVVVDAETGEPVPGATVGILEEGVAWEAIDPRGNQIVDAVPTDAEGTFSIGVGARRGAEHGIVVLADGYALLKEVTLIRHDAPDVQTLEPIRLERE